MRIAIVNDLPMAVEALRRALAEVPRHEVAWVAVDGAQAVRKCADDTPDLVLMDLIMPVMDGAEATRQIMAESPCAILVVTATVEGNIHKVFEAMGHGALDAVNTPRLTDPAGIQALLEKIDIIDRLIRGPADTPTMVDSPASASASTDQPFLIALGASTGGPQALATILSSLPAGFDAAIIAVQHVDKAFAPGLAEWLAKHSALPVHLVTPGRRPRRSTVVLASTDDHLIMQPDMTLAYTPDPLDCSYRPSVDVLFASVARHWAGQGAAALLTGMGRDGAAGLAELKQAGFATFAQDQDSCIVYGMPRAAVELQAAQAVLPLEAIAAALVDARHSARTPS